MMNKIKRLFSIFLSCVMILGLMPTTAFAQESGYTFNPDPGSGTQAILAGSGYTFDTGSGALEILTESGITAWEGVVEPTKI